MLEPASIPATQSKGLTYLRSQAGRGMVNAAQNSRPLTLPSCLGPLLPSLALDQNPHAQACACSL